MERSDFDAERIKVLALRNKTNRDRARNMETRIAKKLHGKRVPFSGAGSIKGDILVHGKHAGGVIECKMSAGYDRRLNRATLILAFSWFEKIKYEAQLMRSIGVQFAALVVHFHNINGDYVFIDLDACKLLCPDFEKKFPIIVVKKYETRTCKLYQNVIHEWLAAYPTVCLETPVGAYQIMTLDLFKELLHEGCEPSEV